MHPRRHLAVALCAACIACCIGCTDSPTSPDRSTVSPPIDHLFIFVRDWPNEYVEIELTRNAGASTVIMYRPAQPAAGGQPAQPRVLLDSIGPGKEDPPEIVELLKTFDVWAMADSNAVGAACNTRSGQWICNPTFNDYSLVMQAFGGGTSRSQRYTRLGESTSSRTARALGDFVLAWARKHEVR
jgi:hypothetical protein